MKEIAIFGGAFDPPTRAHESIIGACLERPDLDAVWLMPSGQRPDKPELSADAARLAMLEVVKETAFNEDDRLVVTDFEHQLGQPNETRRTTAALQEAHPDTAFWYVFGADTYHRMPTWEGGAELRQRIGMLLVPRPGFDLPPESNRIRHLELEAVHADISSSSFREAWRTAQPVEAYIGRSVLRYIEEQALYSQPTVVAGKI